VTVVDTDGGALRLLERGGEATTPFLWPRSRSSATHWRGAPARS